MPNRAEPAPSGESRQPREISSFDEYLVAYFPESQELHQSQALSPQEFGVSMARDSLARLREALAHKGVA